jgi:hypothetical protein
VSGVCSLDPSGKRLRGLFIPAEAKKIIIKIKCIKCKKITDFYALDHDRPLLTVELEVDLSETSLIYLYETNILISI